MVPSDAPITVKWDASKMRHFAPKDGSPIHGESVKAAQVSFELTGETLDASGSPVASASTRALISGSVDNLGQASVVIPSAFAAKYDRFYLEVHDAAADSVGGWNAGYFTVSPSATAGTAKAVAASASKAKSPPSLRARVAAPRPKALTTPALSEEEVSRALQSCKSGVFVGYGATSQGAVDYMTILLWDVPLGYATGIVKLLPVQVVCV